MNDVQTIDTYLRHLATRHLSPRTLDRRRTSLTSLRRYMAPQPPLAANQDDLEAWLRTFASPATRHAYLSDARCFCRWAMRRRLIDTDPTEHIEAVRVPRTLPRPLTDDEFMRALDAANLRMRAVLLLAGLAGLRCAEIAALQAEDCLNGVIVVREGKGARDRAVPMHPEIERALRFLPRRGWLFPSGAVAGAHMRPASLSRSMSEFFARLGIEGGIHRGRHRFGTEASRASNGDLHAVADLMGHSSTSTTLGYARLAGVRRAEVIAALTLPTTG